MAKEAGPEILVQSQLLIVPSGSLDADPSNEMLSVGKVITWSGPAIAVGGLFPLIYPSQESSFLQEINIPPAMMDGIKKERNISFTKEVFNG